MAFNSTINTGTSPNDGQGDGLRTNMRKLIENDNYLKQEHDSLEASHNSLSSTVNNSLTSFKKRNYSVHSTLAKELLAPDGNSLKTNHSYRLKMTISGTGTVTGASYLIRYINSSWELHMIERGGTGSNRPFLFIDTDDKVKLKTVHPATYTVITYLEELQVNYLGKTTFGFWGSDSFFSRLSGLVGLGTETPSEKFEVNGNVKCTSLIQTSDKKYKKNIEQIDGDWALSVFKKLKFSFYDFSLTNNKQAGLIAQEVEKFLPQAVHTSTTGEKGLNYNYIDIVCKAAIQHFIKTTIQ